MSNREIDIAGIRAAALVYADERARAVAERRAYVARMLQASEADDFAFVDDVSYEFLVAKHVGNYSTRLLKQWLLAELMHLNARYYNVLHRTGVKRRVGTLALPNDRVSLERRYAAARRWNGELLQQLEGDPAAAWTIERKRGGGAMKRRIAELRGAIEVELALREKEGTTYQLWGEQRSEHEVYLKSLERPPAEAVIGPRVIPVYPRAHSLAAAKSVRAAAAAKHAIDYCINSAVCAASSKSTSNYYVSPADGSRSGYPQQASAAADADMVREAKRDAYAEGLRAAMKSNEEGIISELGLDKIRRVTPIRHLKARLVLASSKRDQEEVNNIAEVLARKIANKRRIRKKRKANKKRNKEFVRAYVARLAGNASVISQDEDANPDEVPEAAAGATGDDMEDADDDVLSIDDVEAFFNEHEQNEDEPPSPGAGGANIIVA